MSKNKFKISIRERYKGRGNSWVRIEKSDSTYQTILNHLDNLGLNSENSSYIKHIEREGFAWIRFSKPEGTEQNPLSLFEIRYRCSKEDHPDSTILIDDNIAKNFKLLGTTPFKLQLEIEPHLRKEKKISLIKNKSVSKKSLDLDKEIINESAEIRIIKEAALTKPTNKELKEWYDFLKINNIYEESL